MTAIRRYFPFPILLLAALPALVACAAQPDPLPAWSDGPAKQAIVGFVERVTTPGSPDFVPPAERIAVFDNDGTLWSELPWVEGLFWQHLFRQAADNDPSLGEQPVFRAALDDDTGYFLREGYREGSLALRSILEGLDRERYDAEVRAFLAAARYPRLGVPLRQTVFRPSLELIGYLRTNGFKSFICSGGAADFIRVYAADYYGIEPYRVIGTTYGKALDDDGGAALRWTGELHDFNDRDEKAVNIDRYIGRRPILVMGNAGGGGDIGMMRYSQGRDGPTLQLLVEHDDAEREFAYGENDTASPAAAEKYGWVVVSMKNDWATVFDRPAELRQVGSTQ